MAQGYRAVGIHVTSLRRWPEAEPEPTHALEIYRGLGTRWEVGRTLYHLGLRHRRRHSRDDRNQAKARLDEVNSIFSDLGGYGRLARRSKHSHRDHVVHRFDARRPIPRVRPKAAAYCCEFADNGRMTIEYRSLRTNLFPVVRSDDGPCRQTDPTIDWAPARRVRPLDELLPATERWAASLGDAKNLIRLYPRVANRLAFAWQDPKAVQDVFDDLLIDRRGGRQGFPPLVAAELLRLRALRRFYGRSRGD